MWAVKASDQQRIEFSDWPPLRVHGHSEGKLDIDHFPVCTLPLERPKADSLNTRVAVSE